MKRPFLPFLAALLLPAPPAYTAAPPVGPAPVPGFTLTAIDGQRWSLDAQKGKAVVVVFLSSECPMATGYLGQLGDLARAYRGRGVVVVGVNANPEESPADLRAHVREYRVSFPVLKDDEHAAVRALGARVSPEAFVLDSRRVLRYRGRIDDAYTARLRPRGRVGRRDLAEAVEDVLAGRAVKVPRTPAYGCPIPGARRKPACGATVSYYRDVLPILQDNCQSCHRPGQVGPFSLMSYAQAAKWAEDLVGETRAGRMPPWKPRQRGVFTNERGLSAAQVRTLEAWLEQGTPAGDPKDAPPRAAFPDGWRLGRPDLVLQMPDEAVVAASGRDLFRVVVLPTDLPEDRYIAAVEVRPGNPRAVHHTLQVIDTGGRARRLAERAQARQKPDDADRGPGYTTRMGFGFLPNPQRGLGGWAPGLVPQRLPPGVGLKLPKGADVALQVHYHRTGKEERDRTRVGLYFQKGPVTSHFLAMPVPGLFFRIPAGQKDFKVRTAVRTTDDLTLHYLVPHMHLLGKKIELTAQEPGGEEEALISIDAWDYNWQEMYQLKKPRRLPKGTILRVKAEYDNSADNPLNPSDPPRAVRIGEQTTDEMCIVFCGVVAGTPGFPKFQLMLGGS